MDADTLLVAGFVLMVLAIPSMLSASSDRRSPRLGAIVLLLGGGLIVYAVLNKPGGYDIAQLPDVFFSVLARIIP